MQLKNNNPVTMEKRTDLASLFCMIGRHGPAVAVAVIAMVSVMAGFIIYRTVRGKKRKAAAAGRGDGDSRTPRALRDSLMSEQCPEETRSCAESTGLNEDDSSVILNAEVTRSPYNLRNRRSAAEKNAVSNSPQKEVEPERDDITSHVLESSSVAEKCAHDTDAMKNYVSQQNLPCENIKDGDNGICLTPIGTSGHENEEVSRSQAVSTKDILNEAPTQEEEKYSVLNSQVCPENTLVNKIQDVKQENQTPQETISKEFLLEEPIINVDDVLSSSKDSEIKEVHCPVHVQSCQFDGNNLLSTLDEMETAQVDHEEDLVPSEHENVYSVLKPTTMKSSQQDHGEDLMGGTMSGAESGIMVADLGSTNKVIEMDGGSLKNLDSVFIEPATQEYIKQEVKSEKTPDPNCNQETGTEKGIFLPEERDGSSVVLKTAALPCLNMPETTHDDLSATKTKSLDLPSVCLQPEKEVEDTVVPELAKDTGDLNVGCSQSKNETGDQVVISEETAEYIFSSSHRGPTTAVCEMASFSAPVSSTERLYSESSLQNQESDQIKIIDALSDVAAVPVQEMADSIKPQMCQIQLLSCEQSELTWSSSGVGEESGISSMTVSPDLPDIENDGDTVVLCVTDHFPESEDHAEAKGQFFADGEATPFCNEESAGTVFELCPSQISQQADPGQKQVNGELSTSNDDTPGHEIKESSNQEMGSFTEKVPASDACLTDELQKEIDINKKKMVEEDKTTEFSIMEATMDNNEWITDGNYQILPWMKLSVLSVPPDTQTDPASSEHGHTSVTMGDCSDTGTSPSTQVKQTNTVDENQGTDKKVVAVQPMSQTVKVTFRIHYLTHSPYQKVAVTGNQQELGNWNEYLLLEKAKDGLWSTVVSLPAESHVEWKFVVVDQGKVCRWEECGNRLLDTGYGEALLVHKWWGLM